MIRRCIAAALLVTLTSSATPTGAQPPPRGGPGMRPARADTAGFFPDWIHPFFELGGGWMVSPDYMRKYYQSGQGFALGFASRHGQRFGLRTTLDLQFMPAAHYEDVEILWGDPNSGATVADTSTISYEKTAWSGMVRPEIGFMLARDLWLTGGVGGGYVNGGFGKRERLSLTGPHVTTPVGMRNGWGWLWTAAARWDFKPADLAELGVEVRANGVRRGPDLLRGWSVRAIYYVPEAARHPGRRAR